jgi:tRNA threonylcarbamoyl adenosine modification protein (Sua5/YciO/YrdC/YwlC family)
MRILKTNKGKFIIMGTVISIHPQTPQLHLIKRTVEILKSGGIVIYPTDTVYGIGCDITNKHAIERIILIKSRSPKKPFSFICKDLTHISYYAQVSDYAYRILKSFLPGPYTFVLPAQKTVPLILRSPKKTVGVRIPDNKVALELVKELGNPIVSTSANLKEQSVLSDPEDLEKYFGKRVDLILECGTIPDTPSSVISLVGDRAELLREGAGDISSVIS